MSAPSPLSDKILYLQNVPIVLARLVLDAWMPVKHATRDHTGTAAGKKRARDLSGVEVYFGVLLICKYWINISSLNLPNIINILCC